MMILSLLYLTMNMSSKDPRFSIPNLVSHLISITDIDLI